MIRWVIFDLGGVLVRTEDRTPRRVWAEELGMSYQDIDRLVYGSPTAREATLGRITAAEHKRKVLDSLGLPRDDFSPLRDRFWGGDRLDARLVEFIRGLRGPYQTALLSNAWDDLRNQLDTEWGIEDAFDRVFISAELGLAKPDPALYQRVIDSLKCPPEEMVFMDDFIENITAARQAGMNGIHFRSREGALVELAEYLDSEI